MIDVIVPTRNCERTVEACLESLLRQTLPCRIILADGYSADNTVNVAKKLLRPSDLIVHEPVTKNKRRSPEARNEGLKHSDTEFVAFIDADAVAPDTWLEDALEYFDDSTVASVTSGGAHGGLTRLELGIYRVMQIGSTHAQSFKKVREIDSTPGYNAIYRRKAIDEVGGFAELGGIEDWEINWRLRKAGWKILGIPEKPVTHYERNTWRKFFKQMEHNGWCKSVLLKKRGIFTLKYALPFIASVTTVLLTLLQPIWGLATIAAALLGEAALTAKVRGGLHEFLLFIVMHIAWSIGYLEGLTA